jgi:hypothetical protein
MKESIHKALDGCGQARIAADSSRQRGSLPTGNDKRKSIPVFAGCFVYFPDALVAVAQHSQAGNDQHNSGEPLHWARDKSTDELGSLSRHLLDIAKLRGMDSGPTTLDEEFEHARAVAWRALANLQKTCEARAEQKSNSQKFAVRKTDAELAASKRREILAEGRKHVERLQYTWAADFDGTLHIFKDGEEVGSIDGTYGFDSEVEAVDHWIMVTKEPT